MSRPKTTGLLTPQLLQLLAAGETVKSAAYVLRLCNQSVYKLLKGAGWRAVYLSPSEQQQIAAQRQAGASAGRIAA